jgi:SHAQKYF class myb-like DNA-binding protein
VAHHGREPLPDDDTAGAHPAHKSPHRATHITAAATTETTDHTTSGRQGTSAHPELASDDVVGHGLLLDENCIDMDPPPEHHDLAIPGSPSAGSLGMEMRPVSVSPGDDDTDGVTPSHTTNGTEIVAAATNDSFVLHDGADAGVQSLTTDEATMAVRTSLLDAIVQHQAKRISELERRLDKKRTKIELLSTNAAFIPGLPHLGLLQPHEMSASQSAIVAAAAAHMQQQHQHAAPGVPHHNPYLAAADTHMRAAAVVAASAGHMLGLPPGIPPGLPHVVHSSTNDAADRKQSRYWTSDEHQRFLQAVKQCGPKNYVQISEIVGTRNAKQVRTHAQKFQKKLEREDAKRRASGGATGHAATVAAAAAVTGGHPSGLPAVAAAAAAAHAAMHGLDDSSTSDSGKSQYGQDMHDIICSSEGTSSSSDLARDTDGTKESLDPFATSLGDTVEDRSAHNTTEAAAAAAVAAIAAEAVSLGRRAAALVPPVLADVPNLLPGPHPAALGTKEAPPLIPDDSDKPCRGAAASLRPLRSSSDRGRSPSSPGQSSEKRAECVESAPLCSNDLQLPSGNVPTSDNQRNTQTCGQEVSSEHQQEHLDSGDILTDAKVNSDQQPDEPRDPSKHREKAVKVEQSGENLPEQTGPSEESPAESISGADASNVKLEGVHA